MSVPNCISRTEVLEIIKKASYENNIQYRLLSILKYNINLDCEDILYFLKNTEKFEFFSDIKQVDTIYFDKSIHMFHDLNDLIIILCEKNNKISQTKKRISFKNNITRRIYK
jgi:hypothetical protein